MSEKPMKPVRKHQFRVVLNNDRLKMVVWSGEADHPYNAVRMAIKAAGNEKCWPVVDAYVSKWRIVAARFHPMGSISAAKAIAKKHLRNVEYRVDEMHGKCFRLLDIADAKPEAKDVTAAYRSPPLFK